MILTGMTTGVPRLAVADNHRFYVSVVRRNLT